MRRARRVAFNDVLSRGPRAGGVVTGASVTRSGINGRKSTHIQTTISSAAPLCPLSDNLQRTECALSYERPCDDT